MKLTENGLYQVQVLSLPEGNKNAAKKRNDVKQSKIRVNIGVAFPCRRGLLALKKKV